MSRRWYPLALPDGTPLLAYDAEAAFEGDALALAVTLEAASAELLDESGIFGHLHLPDEPRLELRLDLVMARPDAGVAAARGADGAALLAVLGRPEAARAHELGAFELRGAVATLEDPEPDWPV